MSSKEMPSRTREARPRLWVVVWIALALLASLAGPVPAAQAQSAQLTLSPGEARPGTFVTVEGSAFPRNAEVTLSWNGPSTNMPRPDTRRQGTFSARFRVPSGTPGGSYTVQATAGGTSASTTLRVTGGSSPQPTATSAATAVPPTATTAPPPTATRTPVPPPATATSAPSGSVQQRILELVNNARAQQGLSALTLNGSLNQASQGYAQTLASNQSCFRHDCPPVPEMTRRAENAGYTNWRWLGENIAWGQQSAEEVHNAWMNSSGHRDNILNPNFREMGLALVYASNGRPYWVQMFGAR